MKYSRIINAFLLGCLLVVPAAALAQGGLAPVEPNIPGILGGNDILGAIRKILGWLLTLAAIIAALYLIYGGIQYITSAGDTGKTDKAKATILYALVGLVVIGLSFVLVNFILSALQ